jgi:hypothetical protein
VQHHIKSACRLPANIGLTSFKFHDTKTHNKLNFLI